MEERDYPEGNASFSKAAPEVGCNRHRGHYPTQRYRDAAASAGWRPVALQLINRDGLQVQASMGSWNSVSEPRQTWGIPQRFDCAELGIAQRAIPKVRSLGSDLRPNLVTCRLVVRIRMIPNLIWPK